MKATIKIKLGDKVLELQGEGDSKTIVKGFSFWANLPTKCGKCGDTNITLYHKAPKDNDYYGLKCLKCTAELNFGQHKQGGSFFLRAEQQWEVWTPEKRSEEKSEPRDSGEEGVF